MTGVSLGSALVPSNTGSAAFAAIKPKATGAVGRRYSFYSPEMNLLAETEIKTDTGTPAVIYEYVWFNGHPVAQIDAPSTTHWTFTDHLGTPLIQTDTSGTVYWRAEYEPFGRVFAYNPPSLADQHQPLRLPGQEAEQLNLGPNGVTERSYNIFRWYRPNWSRYTQTDPELWTWGGFPVQYAYASENPPRYLDRMGLYWVSPTCDGSPFGSKVKTAIDDVCGKTKPGTKCSDALRNISAALGQDADYLSRCFQKACDGRQPVTCDKCNPYCGQINPGFGLPIITIGGGNGGCPKDKGLGYGETLFHETLHLCGFGGTEPDRPGPNAAWFRYAENACYGWRDPGAPPVGPPVAK